MDHTRCIYTRQQICTVDRVDTCADSSGSCREQHIADLTPCRGPGAPPKVLADGDVQPEKGGEEGLGALGAGAVHLGLSASHLRNTGNWRFPDFKPCKKLR